MTRFVSKVINDLLVGQVFIRLPPHRPDLIEYHAIAPDITGSGECSVEEGLWSHPFDWKRSVLF